MPWNDNAGGGGPWGSGSGGGGGNNPWGQTPRGGGPRGPQSSPPDLEELIRNLQRRFGGGGGGKGRGGAPILFLAALGAIAWVAWPNSGWYTVEPDELGVVLRFGAFDRATNPGFHFKLPTPLEQVLKPNVTQINTLTIGHQADPRRGGADTASLMLTGDENIVDLQFAIQWVIDTENVDDFLFNLDSPAEAVRAVSESAMREVIGQSELQPIISRDIQAIAERVRDKIQETLNLYGAGVIITEVLLEKPTLPEAENAAERGRPETDPLAAFRDVENAEQEKQKAIQDARAYANSVVPDARGQAEKLRAEAQGYRDAVIAEAAGEAERFRLVYEQYRLAPEVTRQRMFLETMERVLGSSNKIILDENSKGQGVVPYLPLNELSRSGAARGGSNEGGRE